MTLPLPWYWPRWIAHRGAGRLAPENTLAAFRLGAQWGWRAFECDVKLSADGVPFLLHDATLARTTSGTGAACDWSWAALSRLDAGSWHSAEYAGEPLLSLQALAEWSLSQPQPVALNLEIKPSPGRDLETGQHVARWAAQGWRHGPAPLLSSFSATALAAAQQVAPELPRALLLDPPPGPVPWRDARALGCVALVVAHHRIRADWLAAAQGAGLRVMAYTVNEVSQADRLLAMGVDGIISDAVDRLGPASEGGVLHRSST